MIEVILVMAISGLLLIVVFIGQRGLRSRWEFDEAVNLFVQDIAYARQYSQANVNETGNGDASSSQNVNPGTTVAGSVIEFEQCDSASCIGSPSLLEFERIFSYNGTYYSNPCAHNAPFPYPCAGSTLDEIEYKPSFLHLPAWLYATQQGTNTPYPESLIAYFNDTKTVCMEEDATSGAFGSPAEYAIFCDPTRPDNVNGLTFDLHDADGHVSTIHIDPNTGVANRLN